MSATSTDLARDLLAAPQMAEAPAEVVRGLCLVAPDGARLPILDCHPDEGWLVDNAPERCPTAVLAAAGWSLDLDSPATAGVLLALLQEAADPDGWKTWLLCPLAGERWEIVDYWPRDWPHEAGAVNVDGPTLARACAEALAVVWGVR